MVAARRVEESEQTVEIIKGNGGEAIFIQTDVSKAADAEAMVKKAVETYGRLDNAFNNAGVFRRATVTDCTEEDWDYVIDINLKGVWLCMKYEILAMLEHGSGSIVNMASVFGLVGGGLSMIDVASRHGVVGLTKSAALEYAARGIRVNAVCPGVIRTPAQPEPNDPDIAAQVVALHPIGRVGRPEEVAEVVMWLCSDASSFVTGHAVPVEGGWTAR